MRRLAAHPFHQTATASAQRVYRNLIKANLRCGEQAVMSKLLNLWFRHSHKGGPLALGNEGIADRTGLTVRQVSRVIKALVRRGFLRLAFGGSGRGNMKRFAVDLTAIRKAFAPGMIVPVKGDILPTPYIAKGKVGSAWVWFSGLWGRSDEFRERFCRAILADTRATWREYVPGASKATLRQPLSSRYGSGVVEAVA